MNLHNYSQEILQAYEKAVFYLPFDKMRHFFKRAYAITGNKKYENIIAYYMYIEKPKRLREALQQLKSQNFSFSGTIKPGAGPRHQARHRFYKKYPKVNFFNNILVDLFFIKKFNLHNTVFKKEFSELINYLKKEDFNDVYLREEVIKHDNSFAINSSFFLRYLEITAIHKKIEILFKKTYFTNDGQLKETLPDWKFSSFIYGMTHIVLADSCYYERYVTGHDWILNYFRARKTEILHRVSLDIIVEIALCFKLCKKDQVYSKEFKKILRHIIKNLHIKQLADVDFLVKKEHTNSLLMILFSDSKMRKGPDLSQNRVFDNLITTS